MLKKLFFILLLLVASVSFAFAQNKQLKMYVVYAFGAPRIDVVDLQTFQIIDRILLETGNPDILALRPDEKVAFVSEIVVADGTGIAVVDLVAKRTTRTLFPGIIVNSMRIGPDGFLYALLGNNQIAVVNTQTFATERTIPLSEGPIGITFSKDGKQAYVITGAIQKTLPSGLLLEVDLTTFSITRTLPNLPPGTTRGTDPLLLSLDETLIYIARNDQISIVNRNSLTIVGSLPAISRMANLQISPDGKILYAVDIAEIDAPDAISVYDLQTRTLIKRLDNNLLGDGDRHIKLVNNGKLLYVRGSSLGFPAYDTTTFNPTLFRSQDGPGDPGSFEIVGDFNSLAQPSIRFLNIKDGDTIQKSKQFTFKWQTIAGSTAIGFHTIEFSLDGGQTFFQQGGLLDGTTQEFTYQASVLPQNNSVVRLTTTDQFANKAVTTVKFSIGDRPPDPTDTQPPTVNFTKPTGGERFVPGDTINITWNSADNIGVTSQDLALSTDGGSTFPVTIASGLTGSIQSFNYQIPSSLETTAGRLRLVVRDLAGNSAQSITTSNFQIQSAPPPDTQAPTITISSPAPSGDLFPAGQAITINWSSIDNIAVTSQELLLSLDDGASFQLISSFGASTSTFTLNNIANLDRFNSNALVRITATDAAGNKGTQTASFILRPDITVTPVYNKPILNIMGNGFAPINATSSLSVVINGKAVLPARITNSSNTSITLKGNKKKLGLIKGSNSVKVVVNGVESNSMSFTF